MIKKNIFILSIIIIFIFSGCSPRAIPEERIDCVIMKEGNYEDIEVFKKMKLENKLLVFYEREDIEDSFGNYIAEFEVIGDKYKFMNIYYLAHIGNEAFISLYDSSGYIFLINNENIQYIKVFDQGKEAFIEVESLPFTYYYEGGEGIEYQFIDYAGNVL